MDALAIDLIEDGEDAALAAPPVRAIDTELPAGYRDTTAKSTGAARHERE